MVSGSFDGASSMAAPCLFVAVAAEIGAGDGSDTVLAGVGSATAGAVVEAGGAWSCMSAKR